MTVYPPTRLRRPAGEWWPGVAFVAADERARRVAGAVGPGLARPGVPRLDRRTRRAVAVDDAVVRRFAAAGLLGALPAARRRLGPGLVGVLACVAAMWVATGLAPRSSRPRALAFDFAVALGLVENLLIGQLPFLLGTAFGVAAVRCMLTGRRPVVTAALAALASLASPLGRRLPAARAAGGGGGQVLARRELRSLRRCWARSSRPWWAVRAGRSRVRGRPCWASPASASPSWCSPRARGGRGRCSRELPARRPRRLRRPGPGRRQHRPAGQARRRPVGLRARPRRAPARGVARAPPRSPASPWRPSCGRPSWPATSMARDATDPSRSEQFYRGLDHYLAAHRATASRIEIPFTREHWESYYVARRFPIARGWERQSDLLYNAVLYRRLTPQRYHHWLAHNAITLVALPRAQLDVGGRPEARLLRHPPGYLTPVYHDAHWQVWRVRHATPLVTGAATLVRQGAAGLVLRFARPGIAIVRVRASALWTTGRPGSLRRRDPRRLAGGARLARRCARPADRAQRRRPHRRGRLHLTLATGSSARRGGAPRAPCAARSSPTAPRTSAREPGHDDPAQQRLARARHAEVDEADRLARRCRRRARRCR